MVDALMRDFMLDAAILGNLSALYFYVYAGLQIPIGLMLDRLGPARLLGGGALIAGAGCGVFAAADSTTWAYAGRLLVGAGAAIELDRRARGDRAEFSARALLDTRRRHAGVRHDRCRDGTAAAQPGGRVPWLARRHGKPGADRRRARSTPARDGARPGAPRSPDRSPRPGFRLAIGNRQTWLCAVFGMAMVGPLVAFAGLWAVPYLMQVHGMSRSSAAGLASLMFLAWGVGSPMLGGLSDRLGKRRIIMVVGAVGATLLLGVLPFMQHAPIAALAALIVAIGLSSSAFVVTSAWRGMPIPSRSAAPCSASSTPPSSRAAPCSSRSSAPFSTATGPGLAADGARIYSPEAFAWALAVLPAACLDGRAAPPCCRAILACGPSPRY